jgi:hypothetical protein
MPRQSYRYYCLDEFGELHNAEIFEAASDDEAIAKVEAEHPEANCEIWQGRRLVGSVSPKLRRA